MKGLGAIADHIKMKAMMNKNIVSNPNFVNNPVGSLSKAIETETLRRMEAIKMKRQISKATKQNNNQSQMLINSQGQSQVREMPPL